MKKICIVGLGRVKNIDEEKISEIVHNLQNKVRGEILATAQAKVPSTGELFPSSNHPNRAKLLKKHPAPHPERKMLNGELLAVLIEDNVSEEDTVNNIRTEELIGLKQEHKNVFIVDDRDERHQMEFDKADNFFSRKASGK